MTKTPDELKRQFITIVEIVFLTIFNCAVMYFILALGAAGNWQNPGHHLDGMYPFIAIGCGWLIFSFIYSIKLWLRKEFYKAVTVSGRVIPITLICLFGFALAFLVVGEIVKFAAPYLGYEIPCAFRWPPCGK